MTHQDDFIRISFIAYVIGRLHLRNWIECGVAEGESAYWWSRFVSNVYGCDINPQSVEIAKARCAHYGCQIEEARSCEWLKGLTVVGPSIFYLDSNWRPELTVFEEIEIILSRWSRCVILVNAAKVEGCPNFISAHEASGRVFSKETAKDLLPRFTQIVFPRYSTPKPAGGWALLNATGKTLKIDDQDFEVLT